MFCPYCGMIDPIRSEDRQGRSTFRCMNCYKRFTLSGVLILESRQKDNRFPLYCDTKSMAANTIFFLNRIMDKEIVITSLSRNQYCHNCGLVKGATIFIDYEDAK